MKARPRYRPRPPGEVVFVRRAAVAASFPGRSMLPMDGVVRAGPVLLECFTRLVGRADHGGQPAMAGTQETVRDCSIQQVEEGVPVAGSVDQQNWLLVDAEQRPGKDL